MEKNGFEKVDNLIYFEISIKHLWIDRTEMQVRIIEVKKFLGAMNMLRKIYREKQKVVWGRKINEVLESFYTK